MAIEKETGVKPVLVHSMKMGALEVKVDNDLIFSKLKMGRFPDHPEVIALIKNK